MAQVFQMAQVTLLMKHGSSISNGSSDMAQVRKQIGVEHKCEKRRAKTQPLKISAEKEVRNNNP